MQSRKRATVFVLLLITFAGGIYIERATSPHANPQAGSGGLEAKPRRRGSIAMQDRRNNCGAAALKMILDSNGLDYTVRELESRMRKEPGGTSLREIVRAAAACGITMKGVRISGGGLRCANFPLLLFLKGSHFVVADSMDSTGMVYLRDPATGFRKMPLQTLREHWGGEALVLQHPKLAWSEN